jgi:hypothetical protein
VHSCTQPTGASANNDDCDDNNAAVHPNATENCSNNIDDDCDGLVDEGSGNALNFDGDNDRVEVPDNPLLDMEPGEPFTIETWIYQNGTAVQEHILGKRSGCFSNTFNYVLFADETQVSFGGSYAPGVVGNGTPLPANIWTHIAVTYNGSTLRMYTNGNLSGTATAPLGPTNDDPLTLGAAGTCGLLLHGSLDEVRIWNTVRTQAQIEGAMNSFLDPSNEPNLIAYYSLNQGIAGGNNSTVTTANDITRNNLDGTLSNFALNGSSSNWINGKVPAPNTFYPDNDGDGYGAGTPIFACLQPNGTSVNNEDCNDANAAVNPVATELCDGIDNDCDNLIDEDFDSDGDGYAPCNGDCNDANANVHPNATEVCNGIDDNCNGQTDEGVKSTFYRDADGDGFGNINLTTQACSAPAGYVSNNTDCNDDPANGGTNVNPNAQEVCNGIDDNCNGQTDEGVKSTFYRDADVDGYGNINITTQACSAPAGYVSNNTDCNDGNASVHPGATEVCNGIDDDCDGQTDEGNVCASPVQISISDASIKEGNSGTKTMSFTVTLNKTSQQTIKVSYTTVNGTAIAPGDYVAKSGTLTFTPGSKRRVIKITIKGDKLKEANETFNVNLSNPVNATILDGTGVGTILNDDGTALTQSVTQTESNTDSHSVKVSPVPVKDRLYVQLYGYTGNVAIQLYSLEGKILKKEKIQSASVKYAQQQINVADINSGVYFLTVIDERGNRHTEKVIVAR